MKLTTRLLALLLAVALIPILILGSWGLIKTREALREDRLEILQTVADLKVHEMNDLVDEQRAQMETMQTSWNIRQNLPILKRELAQTDSAEFRQATEILDSQLPRMREVYGYDNIMLLDAEGRLVYATDYTLIGQRIGMPLPDPFGSIFASARNGVYIGDVFTGHTHEENHLHMMRAVPVNSSAGEFDGVIVFQLDMVALYSHLSGLEKLGKTGEILLGVRNDNTILFISPARIAAHGSEFWEIAWDDSVVATPMKWALQGKSGQGISIDYANREVLATWRPLPDLRWGLVAKVDTVEAFAPVARLQKLGVFAVFVTGLISIGLALASARSVIRPIRKMQEASEKIGAGDYGVRVDTQFNDELGELSKSLEDMAGKLQQSRDRQARAEEIARIGNWELDLTSDTLTWSDEIFRIFEIDPQQFGASYEAFLDAIHPEDRDRVNRAYAESLQKKTPYRIEHRLLMRDGRVKWVLERCESSFDADGRPLRSIGTVQDISEFRLLESAKQEVDEELARINRDLQAQLRDNQEINRQISRKAIEDEETRQAMLLMMEDLNQSNIEIEHAKREWETTFDAVAQPIFLHDNDGRIVRANKAYAGKAGMPPMRLIGRPFWRVFPKTDHRPESCAETATNHLAREEEVEIVSDGSVFSVYMYPVHDANDAFIYSIHIMQDVTERKQALVALEESSKLLASALEGTILAISNAIEARDPYTAGHQQRVATLAVAIARQMGLEPDIVRGIELGAMIHDIGKIHIPAEILSKPGKLSPLEYQIIKEHPEVGYGILGDISFPWPVAEIAHQHHERIDGSGYPKGLKGEAICKEARIVAVADVVEAMASHRPYREGLGIQAALDEISRGRGTHFEPDVVDACLAVFSGGFQLG